MKTCKQCNKEFDPKEAKRVYGATIPELGICSAECYTVFRLNPEPQPKAYRIKPLEWKQKSTEHEIYGCDTLFGKYIIADFAWGFNSLLIKKEDNRIDSLEAAKAAANAHHINQIERYLEEVK